MFEGILPEGVSDSSIHVLPETTKVVGCCNLGNTCYQNVSFQCLTAIPLLYNLLLQKPHTSSHRPRAFCSGCELEKVNFSSKPTNKIKILRRLSVVDMG